MPRDVTITFDDGTSHQYNGVPDEVTPDQITERAGKEFAGKTLKAIDGGKKSKDLKPDGSGKVPRQRSYEDILDNAPLPIANVSAKNLRDTLVGASTSIGRDVAAVGQMVEKPIAAGVNALGGHMKGDTFTKMGKFYEDERPKDNPVADVAGEALASAIPLNAAGKYATAAKAIPRIAKAAGLGGAAAMAQNPVPEEKDFASEKVRQGLGGAAVGGTLAGAGEALRGAVDLVKGKFFGLQSAGARELWDKAKKLGFSIRPEQSRADSARVSQSGLTDEDKIQNAKAGAKMVSKEVGAETSKLTPAWYDDQFKSLGKKYDSVYAPKDANGNTRLLKIDSKAVTDLKDLVDRQSQAPFMSTKAVKAANSIITEFENAQAMAGPNAKNITKVGLPAGLLQDLRTNLRQSASLTSDRINAHAMHEVVGAIDDSVERNHPAMAAVLKDANPKYRALLTLEYGRQHGFVDKEGSVDLEALGEYLRSTDKKVVRNTSSHPLAEAGELGEALGIRSISKPSVAGSRWSGSGDEEFSPTRAGIWRAGTQQVKRLPGVRSAHENYLKSGTGHRAKNTAAYSLSGAIVAPATNVPEDAKSLKRALVGE
jgi:hypothetical protein